MEPRDVFQILLEGARAGDRQDFGELLKHFEGFLKSIIQLELGSRMDERIEVNDLLQETWLRAYRSIGQFHGHDDATLRHWLASIARHTVRDEARRQRVRKIVPGDPVPLTDNLPRKQGGHSIGQSFLEAKGESPSNSLRKHERFDRLKNALSSLSPDHLQVVLLARLKGYPIKDVAVRMGRSPDATSALLTRALLKLKTFFGSTDGLELPPDRSLEMERGPDGE